MFLTFFKLFKVITHDLTRVTNIVYFYYLISTLQLVQLEIWSIFLTSLLTIFDFDYFISLVRSIGCFLFNTNIVSKYIKFKTQPSIVQNLHRLSKEIRKYLTFYIFFFFFKSIKDCCF